MTEPRSSLVATDRAARVLDAISDWSIGVLAAFTVAYQVALFARLSRSVALVGFVIALVVLLFWWWRWGRRVVPAGDTQAIPTSRIGLRAIAVLALAVVAGVIAVLGRSTIFWAVCVLTVALGSWLALRDARSDESGVARSWRWDIAVVLVAALAFAALTVLVNAPTGDDTYYLNRALYIENNDGPFPTRDTVFGDQTLPTVAPPDLIASYEGFVGTAAAALPIDVRTLYFLVFPTIVAALGVLAMWRLARTVAANRPAVATIAALAFVCLHSALNGWGPMALRRPFWGKSMLLFFAVPFLWHHALSFARTGDRRSLAWTGLGAIAAIGFSSSGAFVGVVVVAAALAPLLLAQPRADSIKRLATGGLAVVYPLVVGALGSLAMTGSGLTYSTRNQTFLDVWEMGIGRQAVELFVVTVIVLFGWTIVRANDGRLGFAAALLAIAVVLSPPGLAMLTKVGALSVSWRFLWALPVPLLAGLIVDTPLAWRARKTGIAVALVVALVVLGPLAQGRWLGGRADIGRPAWDIDARALHGARRLVALAGGEGIVAAPSAVSGVVPMISLSVFAANPRGGYVHKLKQVVSARRFHGDERQLINAVLDGRAKTVDGFADALETLDVEVVSVYRGFVDPVRSELRGADFEQIESDRMFTYWRR